MKKLILLFLPILTFISCNQGTNVKETGETGELKDYVLTELWRTDTIFTTCESVLYHPESDVLFVA